MLGLRPPETSAVAEAQLRAEMSNHSAEKSEPRVAERSKVKEPPGGAKQRCSFPGSTMPNPVLHAVREGTKCASGSLRERLSTSPMACLTLSSVADGKPSRD